LVSLGYRVWAPNQRGYGRTSKPPKISDYEISHLMDDVSALIDASGATSVTLIAHDWGAAVAWFYAMRLPRPIERLVICNVPHPVLFSKALRSSWAQKARSWYMAFFQIPKLPEFLLGRRHAYAIGEVFRRSATDPSRFTPDVLAFYRDAASIPGQLRAGVPKIAVPTMLVWGEADTALGKETTYGTEAYVENLSVHYLPGVSHWVQQDAPERVNELLEAFLRVPAATGP
jgi:pimeloyl-ACP methyl ester carboxylesterase